MIDFDNLPRDDAQAFVVLEEAFRAEMQAAGTGTGTRLLSPAYSYFNKVAAAAHKLGIDDAIAEYEMPQPGDEKFQAAFAAFLHLVERRVVEIRIDAGRRTPRQPAQRGRWALFFREP